MFNTVLINTSCKTAAADKRHAIITTCTVKYAPYNLQ